MSNDSRTNINDLNDILKLAGLCESIDISANRLKRGGVIDNKELDESDPAIIDDEDDDNVGFEDELELDLPEPKMRGARQEPELDKKYDDWYWGDKDKDFSESVEEGVSDENNDDENEDESVDEAVDEDFLMPKVKDQYVTSEEDLPDDPLADDEDGFDLSAEIKKATSGNDQYFGDSEDEYELSDDDRWDNEVNHDDGEEDYTDYSMRRGEMGEAYQRKTEDEFTLQGNYGEGWEDLTSEKTRKDILKRKREYEENEGGNYRTIIRKVKKAPIEEQDGLEEGFFDDLPTGDWGEFVNHSKKAGEIEKPWHGMGDETNDEYDDEYDDELELNAYGSADIDVNEPSFKPTPYKHIQPNEILDFHNWLKAKDGELDEADYDDSNGYGSEKEYYANDTFPRGNHGSVSDAKGPASAKYGDNPLQSRMMETKQIQKDLWESLKLFKESAGGTCAGGIAGVAKPLGKTQKRVKEETNNKYENSDCKMKPYKSPKRK